MAYLAPLPVELEQVECVRIYYHLQLQETCELPPLALLQLRRELLQALRTLANWGTGDEVEQLQALFQPPVPADPIIRKQAQKPAPAFVLSPKPQLAGPLSIGQRIVLPVLFVGSGILALNAFGVLLAQLGRQGLYHGQGQFQLEAMEAEDASGVRSMLWSGGVPEPVVPPLGNLRWYLERHEFIPDRLCLEIVSPLRLLKNNKPLFRADFRQLFPFLLRRVSALLACHAGVEVIRNPGWWHELAGEVEEVENCVRWTDWRQLRGDEKEQNLGGLTGHLQVKGDKLGELFWVLQFGSLVNFGKGAAYGAGQFLLRTHCRD